MGEQYNRAPGLTHSTETRSAPWRVGQWQASKRGSPAQPHATPRDEGNQLLLVHLPLVYGDVRALEVVVIERVVPRDEGRFRRAAGCQPCGQDRRCLFVRLTSKADSRFSPIPPSGVEGGEGSTSAVPICMYARTMLITWFIMMASALWSVKDSPAFISCRRRIRCGFASDGYATSAKRPTGTSAPTVAASRVIPIPADTWCDACC